MTRCLIVLLVGVLLLPVRTPAAPLADEPRPHPGRISALPSHVQRVEPAIVALRVQADPRAPSSARLGHDRFASGVIFDGRGYAVTVSYAVLDAVTIEARLRDGRAVAARVAGLDLESGLGVIKLEGAGPWPVAALGQAGPVTPGALTATVGVDEDGDLVQVPGAVREIRRFSAAWEYMLERALFVAPASPAWSGNAVVNAEGGVIGIVSLRLAEESPVNVAIPIETFLPVKDELIAEGRVVSRRPRPWLGVYTVTTRAGVVIEGFAPVGPARAAGFQRGDRIVSVNGVAVASQEEFYDQLWRSRVGDLVRVTVRRQTGVQVVGVRAIDRYQLLRARGR